MSATTPILLDGSRLTTLDVWRVAHGQAELRLSDDPKFQDRLQQSRATLERAILSGQTVYGVSTGFGDSVETRVDVEAQAGLGRNLARYHRIGFGPPMSRVEGRAVMVSRLISLARGLSAVRPRVLDQLVGLLKADIVPVIPSRGSVGASGDLTPLAYVAAALCGEGTAYVGNEQVDMESALRGRAIASLELDARETLAIMNGTSAMAALGALSVERARRVLRWATALSALTLEALESNPSQFDPVGVAAKDHPGSIQVAKALTADLTGYTASPGRLQERYSVRCTPQVLGVALDICTDAKRYTENELNGCSDNPLFDPNGSIFHGGNFYGGHICQAMDSLRAQLVNVADLLERQLILLCTPSSNAGLPPNLVKNSTEHPARHGFKAAQITASALVAEAAQLSLPASVLSRSTENHNQDKVSMGMLAARSCINVLDLVEGVAGIHTLAVLQALEIRSSAPRSARSVALVSKVRETVPALEDDRPMDVDLAQVLDLYRAEHLPLGTEF